MLDPRILFPPHVSKCKHKASVRAPIHAERQIVVERGPQQFGKLDAKRHRTDEDRGRADLDATIVQDPQALNRLWI